MNKPRVYFADRQARPDYNMLDKLEHIFNEMGLSEAIEPDEKVMIKTHFGLYGNTNHVRPAYARKLVDLVRGAGGFPFVADTASLAYGVGRPYGGRTTAPEYLMRAARNGFTQGVLGAPIIIADGYWGVDTYSVPIEGKHLKSVPVAGATLDCDKVILLTHAKFHHMGIAATLKNLGVGMVGKQGKAAVHCPDGLQVNPENCLGAECSKCVPVCPKRCIEVYSTVKVDETLCVTCGHCSSVCRATNTNTLIMAWAGEGMAERVVENALGVITSIGQNRFYYFNLAIDISDHCDCICVGAPLMMHDVGILGSADPVAVDHATLEVMKKAALNPDSSRAHDFESLALRSVSFLEHGSKIGLGTLDYEFVTLSREKEQ